jgi:hypothetical protein
MRKMQTDNNRPLRAVFYKERRRRMGAGWEDDEGGSQLGVHRVAPPASKAVPMFLSVGRSANDAKALPKRRLSKFGTPDVNRPPPPKPVEVNFRPQN